MDKNTIEFHHFLVLSPYTAHWGSFGRACLCSKTEDWKPETCTMLSQYR